MNGRSPLVVLALCAALVGCKKTVAPDAGPTYEVAITRTRLAAPRATTSGAAFDLVPLADGALIVWGRPSRLGGGLQLARLDAWGSAVGNEQLAYAPALPAGGTSAERIAEDALELDAAVARGSIAIAWVARNQLELSVKSIVGDLASMRFGGPILLGPTTRSRIGGRGYVTVAASDDGTFQGIVRLADAPCAGSPSATCAQVGSAELRATQAVPAGVPLAIPDACAQTVVGAAWVGRRFHYGVCSMREGAPLTTAYTIEPDSQVARSDELLPGCQPDGFLSTGSELLIAGRCAGGRAGARMANTAHGMRALPMDSVQIRCEGRVPVIQTAPELGATVRLTTPLDHLEALLPQNVAPTGSRAVWTGKTVLIAQPIEGEVALHRFDCDRGQFVQTDFM